ncbi:TrbI/VirB10 family protein [Ferrimonas kyonanensis]|uniref:TrbI/VirB10 family protein n=1 Tax=Ferrimonas kyonanensis TaxID=364763 RepID=UPI0004266981|nr:TrbI/VirB10 family protein [Ferrimonas kyonanensis]
MDIKSLWMNRKIRISVLAVATMAVGYWVMSSMFFAEADGLTAAERREQRLRQEEARKNQRKGGGLLDTSIVNQLDQQAFEAVVNSASDQLQVQQDAIIREKRELQDLLEQQQGMIDKQSTEMAELRRQVNLLAQGNRRQSDVQRLPDGTVQMANTDGQFIRGGGRMVAPGVIEQTPTQIVTPAPAIQGKVIRTITQRSVRDVRRSGQVVEQATEHSVISAGNTDTTSFDANGKEIVKEKPSEAPELKSTNYYLPSGSFFKAVLLSGIDAPTAMAAREAPVPVVLRIKGETILPNRHSMDLRECHGIASSVGNLGTTRAETRLERISCVVNGKALDIPITAYAVSEGDGKPGIEGTLVQKNGNILARVMAAEFLAGFSQAAAPQRIGSFNTSPDEDAVWQSIDLGQYGAAGVMQGAAGALNKLSDYYMELANAAHPVISVSAGREVSFVTLNGTNINLNFVQ